MKNQRGSVLVEFAIVLPIAGFLFLGGMDLLMAVSSSAKVEYVAEETARCEGMKNPSCGPDINGNSQGSSYAQQLAAGIGLTHPTTIVVTENSCSQCISVTVAYRYDPLFHFIPVVPMSRTAQFTVQSSVKGGS